jgi:predicted dehydrogenase
MEHQTDSMIQQKNTMNSLNRRNFLKRSLLGAATVSFSALSWSQVAGANSAIRSAVVGFAGRGGSHISGLGNLSAQGVRMVGLCDVDSNVLRGGVSKLDKEGTRVDGYTDIRKLLERKDLDVISIATPNHWHALATIWSVQAGKDVYVEKPVCHNVWEGRKMVEAARKYKKIVQTGTQCRSSSGIREAVQWVQGGNLGKIIAARGLCYKPRGTIGRVEQDQPIPDSINYDLWCGPAPMDPLRRARLHYDWHWIWDFGNGDLGNQGIHQMDIARWFLGENDLSPRVMSVGGRVGYVDDGQTPNTQFVYHEYDSAPLIFEVRGLRENASSKSMDKFPDAETGGSVGVVIHCEGGYVVVPNYDSAIAYDKDRKKIKQWRGASDHFENFINAVRSRKTEDLSADIHEGFVSSSLCHTGNISHRLGSKRSPNEIREEIKGSRHALETYERMQAHLEANEIDLNNEKLTLGPMLSMNPNRRRFIGNTEANALLTRHYRRPYVVPEVV